ncbi:hypothetical protein EV401DRAFT_1854927 [Pisolithus croceorrhizus]|nr:hypothetical protein EV401DRAFT_1854927 [Pisolithus croceorrhizus]
MTVPLEQLVNEWLRLDPNPITRDEIRRLWDQQKSDELERRMRTRIEFGTAGLRGKMEAGWARMNDLIIIQASQGLCAYVLRSVPEASMRGVVVGHDHRHNSERWASLTAQVFISNNIKVYFHRGLVHTPMVPFSVKKLNAACGVMITASHNPKDDNGYKVYWENAVQIIGPHDVGIAESILQNLEPRLDNMSDVYTSPLCVDCSDSMRESYFTLIQGLVTAEVAHPSAKFVNTSMHGVSDPFISEAFRKTGFTPCIPVEKQRLPDPDFPTVKFPNPEEKGKQDLALSEATASGANYVLAQDPDADRFTAAERGTDGSWFLFTGDQLGALFASHVLSKYKATGKPLGKLAMIASTVSSRMIEAMARVEGFKFVDCLTGFKFIGNNALDLVAAGYEVPFGYEEAIGFMFGSEIRDKDGVAAAVMFAELVAEVQGRGLTVRGYLDELYQRYGYFETKNSYFACSDPVTIDRIFWGIRHFQESDSTIRFPTSIAGLTVNSVIDLTAGYGYDSTNAPSYQPRLPLSSGHMVQFRAQSTNDPDIKIVLTVRTSGTEPKIKYYLEGSAKDRQKLTGVLNLIVKDLADVWMKASEYGLRSP